MTTDELRHIALVTQEEIRRAVQAATDPLIARLNALEAVSHDAPQPGPAGERGLDGRDGRDGKDGKDGSHGRDGIDGRAGDKGLDGRDGNDGEAGFSLEDFDVTYDGERTFTFSFTRGDVQKSRTVETPFMLYRGVFEAGREYRAGDVVTWAGSLFIAKSTTTDKPEQTKAWQLAAKRGRDGRDGKDGDRGDRGPQGDKGDPGRHAY